MLSLSRTGGDAAEDDDHSTPSPSTAPLAEAAEEGMSKPCHASPMQCRSLPSCQGHQRKEEGEGKRSETGGSGVSSGEGWGCLWSLVETL